MLFSLSLWLSPHLLYLAYSTYHLRLPSPTFTITTWFSYPSPHTWCLPHFTHTPPTTYAHNRPTTRSAPFSLNKCQSYPLLSFYVLRIIIQGMKSLLITQHNHPTARFASFPLSLCQSYPLLLLYFFDHTCQIIINQGMRSLLVNKARCITTNIQIIIYF